MVEQLRDCKRRLSKEFVGRDGVHGLGIRKSARAIVAYVNGPEDGGQTAVLEELRQAAAPYRVEIVREDAPTLAVDF